MALVKPIHALILATLLAITSWTVPTVASEDGSDTLLEDGSGGLYSVQEASRHGRVKRQTITTLAGLQIHMVIDALNDIRSSVNPTESDMEQLVSMNMCQYEVFNFNYFLLYIIRTRARWLIKDDF